MKKKITIEIDDDLSAWLTHQANEAGVPESVFARKQLEKSKASGKRNPFRKFSGILDGLPADLSQRKGYARK